MRKRSDRLGKSTDKKPRVVHRETSHEKAQERPISYSSSRRCMKTLKRLVVAFGVLYLCIPFVVRLFPGILYHAVFSHVARIPFFADLSQPADLGLNHTYNIYMSSEKDITLGVWHTVPDSLWQEAQGKDLGWYEQTLQNGAPVLIYLHGNGGTRGASHRVGLVNALTAAGFHVVSLDYRGFGDSSGEPTEAGLTTDTLYVYQWVKARSGSSPVILWGHSLGTGVATNTALELQDQGVTVDAVILEGAFSNIREAGASHPFARIYRNFPYFEYFFLDVISENKVVFPNDENVRKLKTPLLFLHAEDDNIVPFHMGQELFAIAQKSRKSSNSVRIVPFEGFHGFKHNGLYQDPRLPEIIKQFVQSLNI
ncbi:lysophosphatidylserine lipase ABHD12-like isoform X1 [Alosa pseudoharengus]|uniref:lysophosphatidylserine lipase ABHD12-like isoform X1 n=1 Tax=Alosa pseudoharengus TaxID=34774 RepID=UPI003F89538A